MSSLSEPLAQLRDVMDALGADWCVSGPQAVNAWLSPRLTVEWDVLAHTDIDGLARAMADAGFEVKHVSDAPTVRKFVFGPTLLHVVVADSGLEELILRRARVRTLHGVDVPVMSPEDIVISKLLAWRLTDRQDLDHLLVLDHLDLIYVQALADQIDQVLDKGLGARLQEALERAGG